MPLNIESEIVELVRDPEVSSTLGGPSAFSSPIVDGLGLPAPSPEDPIVLQRMCYNQVPQDILNLPAPYMFWTGPFNYDKGQASTDESGTKKAEFWFWFCHYTATDAMAWANDVEAAISRLTFPYPLRACRLTAAIYMSKHPMMDDQVLKTSQEFPVSQACLGYIFGYQQA